MTDTTNALVYIVDGIPVPVADSRTVANFFEKRHDHLVRDIDKIITDLIEVEKPDSILNIPNFGDIQNYFIKGDCIDNRGRKQRLYYLTQDGFTLAVMGFTGKKALQMKLAFLSKYHALEQELAAIHAAEYRRMQFETRQAYLMPYHSCSDAIKDLIDYAVDVWGAERDAIDPHYYAIINYNINHAVQVVKGTRKDADPETNVRLGDLHRWAAEAIRGGIAREDHFDTVFHDALGKIKLYKTLVLGNRDRQNRIASDNVFTKRGIRRIK